MDMNSRGPRTVVVTGASSGIGRATALRLYEEGYRVLAIARRRERLEDLARMVNDPEKFDVLACDVSVDE
ncbi:MAG: SDR family NAD(P)-dependent oxidoreductase, partial [Dermabacter sp.]|nr:SDR family NAD(P)-dependent oxidoreductase [Dermabacter sp.]